VNKLSVMMLRLPDALTVSGLSRRSFYRAIRAGLLPETVRIGPRAVASPSHELEEINHARAAGFDDECVKALVKRQMAAREQRARHLTPQAA
jgi:predicted DNA-binding transcriptional regulator AlpA